MKHRTGFITLSTAAVVALASCGDGVGLGDEQTTLSFAVAAAALADATATEPIVCTDGTHRLVIEQVVVSFDDLELERADEDDADSDSDQDSDGWPDETLYDGPGSVDLPLRGGVITPFGSLIPPGRYDELEMDIRTVRVRGIYDGRPFDITLATPVEVELELEPPLEVHDDGDAGNLTAVVDPCRWFRRADGSLIDPASVNADPALRQLVQQQIRESFQAFEDDDRDADDEDSDSDSE